nr:MAG TPA: hypothetical protein [Caudoviricetes sp.]
MNFFDQRLLSYVYFISLIHGNSISLFRPILRIYAGDNFLRKKVSYGSSGKNQIC